MDALLKLLVGGLADEHGPVVLGLHLHLEDVGGDFAAVFARLHSSVNALQEIIKLVKTGLHCRSLLVKQMNGYSTGCTGSVFDCW